MANQDATDVASFFLLRRKKSMKCFAQEKRIFPDRTKENPMYVYLWHDNKLIFPISVSHGYPMNVFRMNLTITNQMSNAG